MVVYKQLQQIKVLSCHDFNTFVSVRVRCTVRGRHSNSHAVSYEELNGKTELKCNVLLMYLIIHTQGFFLNINRFH